MTTDSQKAGQHPRALGWCLGSGTEALLVFLLLCQIHEGALVVYFYNLSVIIHYPFFILAPVGGNSIILGIALLIGYEATMAWLWSLLFNYFIRIIREKCSESKNSRNQAIVFTGALAMLATGAFAWNAIDYSNDCPTPFKPSTNVLSVAAGNNQFALDLYQRLREKPGNLFFSPYSISTGMGMVYAGAGGSTKSELANVLHFNHADEVLHPALGELAGRLTAIQHRGHLTLLPANSLWYQKDYPFKSSYTNLLRTDYRGEAFPVDFINSAESAGKEIGSWITRKTEGRIKDAVGPGLIDPQTKLVLCDAIYFKGEWASQFRKNQTKPGPFYISTNETVTVPVMHQKASFRMVEPFYDDRSWMDMVELPYFGRDTSMVILLPHQVDGLPALETNLSLANFGEWLKQLDTAALHEINVSLPRFRVAKGIALTNELRSMGMTNLFDDNADLSGMDGTKNLYISDVLHQAFVEVNEHGTEAAAITIEIAKSKGMNGLFNADHPFIFLIRENTTGCILFMGRLTDPTKE